VYDSGSAVATAEVVSMSLARLFAVIAPSLWLAVGLWAGLTTARADAPAFAGRTTLVMVDDINCGYCRKWEREVGPGYAKSVEGQYAPLSKIRRGDPRLQGISSLAYTPTFVLFVQGREAGRIVGYPGADFFWAEITQLVKRGGFTAPAPEQRADLPPPLARTFQAIR
jgi:hypothetical protein